MVEKYNNSDKAQLSHLAFAFVLATISVALFLLGTVSTGAFPKVVGAYEIRHEL